MKKSITKIVTVFVMAFALLGVSIAATPPPPSHAITGIFGGKVILKSTSTGNLKVSGGLAKSGTRYVMKTPIGWIAPGQNSRTHAHIYDADAFLAPKGCKTYMSYGSGKRMSVPAGMVKKIGDFSTTTVTVNC